MKKSLENSAPPRHRRERNGYRDIYVAKNVVVVELAIRGTHKGQLALVSGTLARTGKAIDVPCCDVFHLESGKIISFHYCNQPSVMQQQLGNLASATAELPTPSAIRWKEMESSMSIQNNVQIVKDFFAAMGSGDKQGLLALTAEDIEWIIPGEDWALAGTHRGHAGLADLLQKASATVETSFPEPPEFVALGDRVLVVGFAKGRIKATNRTWEDHWVFAITVRNGKLTNIREYVDTQALARASENSGIRN
jgi:uncharacterized protein